MIKAPTSLTKAQQVKIDSYYINPFIEIIQDALADIKGIKADEALKQLIALVVKDKKQYKKETLELPIGEGVAQKDISLFNNIKSILPKSSDEERQPVYDALYKLFHEFRLNKSPDSPFADEHNTAIVAKYTVNGVYNPEKGYNEAYQKTGTLAKRLLGDGPETTPEIIEAYVLASLHKFLNVNVKVEAKSQVSAPEKPEIKPSSSMKRAASSIEAELDFMTEAEIAEYFRIVEGTKPKQDYMPAYGAKKQSKLASSTDNLDYQLALSLQQEEQNRVAPSSSVTPMLKPPAAKKSPFGWW